MKHTWVGMFPADDEEEVNDCYSLSLSLLLTLTCDSETPMNGARFELCAGHTTIIILLNITAAKEEGRGSRFH